MHSSGRRRAVAALVCVLAGQLLLTPRGAAADARSDYSAIRARETVVRRDLDTQPEGTTSLPVLRKVRQVVGEYERMSRAFPVSGYSDNALWQAALLSADAYWTFGDDDDRKAALRLFASVKSQFPASSLNRQAASHVERLRKARTPAPAPPAPVAVAATAPARATVSVPATATGSMLKSIRRETLPGVFRIVLELERETTFQDERIDGPPRVFVDLRQTRPAAALKDTTVPFGDEVVRQARIGASTGGTTRVVFDLHAGAAGHSVYALYDPYRIVIDFEGTTAPAPAAVMTPPVLAAAKTPAPARLPLTKEPVAVLAVKPPAPAAIAKPDSDPSGASWTPELLPSSGATLPTPPAVPQTASAPSAPAANLKGGFSLSRQLGLGIGRIVIDAGHGGHDPGAKIKGLNEAELVLDVAQRLEKLLNAVPGVEVVMTRKSNVYVPLEERTSIANRAEADLFLSIHANASENPRARGIETYFLNFAPNPEAEAVAARENAGAARTMHNLPDIVKAIALNNKIDESRDFATMVQKAMVERLKRATSETKDLGVKQAPFMVLIGATMPSVLAEISFLTHKQESTLLKTPIYRQHVAEALFNGIMRYQKAQKSTATVAEK